MRHPEGNNREDSHTGPVDMGEVEQGGVKLSGYRDNLGITCVSQ